MNTILLGTVSLLFSASFLATSLSAQERATVHVGKAGMCSALGHEYEIRGVIDSGSAETGAHHVGPLAD